MGYTLKHTPTHSHTNLSRAPSKRPAIGDQICSLDFLRKKSITYTDILTGSLKHHMLQHSLLFHNVKTTDGIIIKIKMDIAITMQAVVGG